MLKQAKSHRCGPVKECPVCKSSFRPIRSHGIFCTRGCASKFQHMKIKATGDKNPNWKGGPASITCRQCRKVFEVEYNRRNTAVFCSIDCADDWQTLHPYVSIRAKRIPVVCRECGGNRIVRESQADKYRFCSPKCRRRWVRSNRGGSKGCNWLGGTSKLPYPFDWDRISDEIMERDGSRCCNPHCHKKYDRITVHHIDYDKMNSDRRNLITVCARCNSRANYHRPLWTRYYQRLIQKMYPLRDGNGWRREVFSERTSNALP